MPAAAAASAADPRPAVLSPAQKLAQQVQQVQQATTFPPAVRSLPQAPLLQRALLKLLDHKPALCHVLGPAAVLRLLRMSPEHALPAVCQARQEDSHHVRAALQRFERCCDGIEGCFVVHKGYTVDRARWLWEDVAGLGEGSARAPAVARAWWCRKPTVRAWLEVSLGAVQVQVQVQQRKSLWFQAC